ncbi:unannotated protein [freshwater metagenome]|uniref:Unannotated protein n=1 Tax=freshwater metagenome TaxID=449393 RepID=A0A6J7T227_9ZZZZ
METTDGRTLCAIPATESAFLSIVLDAVTSFTWWCTSELMLEEFPRAPPIIPATIDMMMALESEIRLGLGF